MIPNLNKPTTLGRLRLFFAYAFWIHPAIAALCALLLARYTSQLQYTLPVEFGGVLTTGGATGARDLVQSVATSSLTIATLVFSVTVAVLQIAAAQYSPRVPARFLRDITTQIVMAVFIFTFVYSLSVVRSIHAGNGYVPQLAVTLAFLLVLCSVAAFIKFIHHIINQMRVEQILSYVEAEALRSLDRMYEDRGEKEPHDPAIDIPDFAQPVIADWVGIVQRIDGGALVPLAVERDLVICIVKGLGDRVTRRTPIAWAWCRDNPEAEGVGQWLAPELRRVLQLGDERTLKDDVAFGLLQMVDIALRALSPAINDPTTAVNTLKSAQSVLVKLCGKRLGPRLHFDEGGELRVMVPDHSFTAFLEMVVTPIRCASPHDRSVMEGLCRMLADVARATRDPEDLEAISDHTERVIRAAQRNLDDEMDVAGVTNAAKSVELAVSGAPPRLT